MIKNPVKAGFFYAGQAMLSGLGAENAFSVAGNSC